MTELLLQREDGYAVLTLNRPDARNALSPQLLLDLCDAFRLLQDESDIYSVILTGAGTAFCAGLDLKAMAEDESGLGVYAIHAQHDITAAMTAFDRPIIVGVNGVAATGGFELALMGDILLASSGARFADTHCRVGLAPGWGLSQKLARIIGPSRAREAHFTGNVISAQQAEAWGLVSRVVAPEDLLDACRQVAMDIASCVPETAMERSVMTDVNQRVSGDVIANRRSSVQQRGKNQ